MKKYLYAAMLLLGLGRVGCQKESEPIKVTGVVLDSTSLSLSEGETATLSATVTPSDAENKNVHWSTSSSDVATVSNGTVTAVKEGKATITVTTDDGGKTATCQVEVKSKTVAVESVSLDKTEAELTEGDELTLTATVRPDNASNKNIEWSSSEEKVATVKDGKVTAMKAGTAKITVKTVDGAKTAECVVTVKEKVYAVESVSLDKTSIELTEGDNATLTATVKPDNATNKNVTWSSSDEAVAKVSNGEVTAVKAGTAKITVKTEDGAKIAECAVTVKAKVYPVESVSLDKTSLELTEGDKSTLTATVKPDNATNKNVTWSSSDEAVAKVSNGEVTAVKAGTAKITVKTEDGAKTAECAVTVKAKFYYIDEYGINRGAGVTIDGITWAPVNCGYKEKTASSEGFPYGKLYQWGRKYGDGYGAPYHSEHPTDANYSDESTPVNYVEWWNGKNENSDNETFYYGVSSERNYDWIQTTDNSFWNVGTETNPVKNEKYDPCPDGWRVPTQTELFSLVAHSSSFVQIDGQNGKWFSGSSTYSESLPAKLFLPATGTRFADKWFHNCGAVGRSYDGHYWTSSTESVHAVCFIFEANKNHDKGQDPRGQGNAVRCVKE